MSSLVFEDTEIHEAWNRAESQKVILIIDVYIFMLKGPLVLQEFAFKNTVSKFSEIECSEMFDV